MVSIAFNTWFVLVWALVYLAADYYQYTIQYGAISRLFKMVSIILFFTVVVVILLVGGELSLTTAWNSPFVNITTTAK